MNATILCAGCQHAYAATALFCPNCGRPRVREAIADPLLGKLLGERFLVQELIGQGGSGTIYRAEHVTLRRRVAIKVLHTELSRDDLAVERFRREATTVAEIDNEHIVEIHDFGRTPDGRLYLAMELLDGETLDGVLAREKQLSVERAADILIQVGEALMEAHAIGYVHRDLRPRNIYLAVRRGKANFIKLLDFGLAKLVETEGQAASTSLGMTFGDPRYMSPEQARGDRIDRRADIYQLGCVAYEMLTGAPPFGGNRVFDILTKQVTEVPQPLPSRRPGVPLWMEAAVTKMLAKDPENRFATTTRMVEALRRGLETGEVMEDDVARRRESIPPPSVSRVMQRMGMQPPGAEPPRAEAAPAPAPAVTPAAPVLPASAAVPAPAARPSAPSAPSVGPGVTMRAPVAPPPGKPDSVELLRKRTGTPRIGVPLLDPAVVLPSQSPVALPGQPNAPSTQPSVAGVIDPPPAAPAAPAAPIDPAAPIVPSGRTAPASGRAGSASGAPSSPSSPSASSGRAGAPALASAAAPRAGQAAAGRSAAVPPSGAAAGRSAASAASPSVRLDADAVLPPTSPEDAQPRGKPQRPPAAELNISQVWYDEGDELSKDADDPSRTARTRKALSMSTTDVGYYDEPPRRRWGLIAGVGTFAIVGGIVAFAMVRGGSSSKAPAAVVEPAAPAPAAPAALPPIEPPPPSQIVASPDPAKPAEARAAKAADAKAADAKAADAKAADAKAADTKAADAKAADAKADAKAARAVDPPRAVAPPPSRPAAPPRRVAEAPAEPRSPAGRRAAEPSYPVLGSEPTRRPPSLGSLSPSTPAAPAADTARPPSPPSLTDSPKDPYGDESPGDGAPPERKAEFYANLGGQQLTAGDTAGAAASFKKALELDARSVVAMMGMGEIALRQGLFGDAIFHLSKASKLVPKNVRILVLLGEAYLNSGNNAQAAAQFKKALQLDPDNARARDGYNEASSRVPPPQDDAP